MNFNIETEYNTLKKGVGIRDISNSLIIKLTGKDALDYINRISTNYVKDLPLMSSINTIFTNEKGRFIDSTVLLNMGDYYLLIGNSDNDKKLNVWIDRYIITEDLTTEIVTDKYFIAQLYGAQTLSFLSMICGQEIKDLPDKNINFYQTDSVGFYLFKYFIKKDFYSYCLLTEKSNEKTLIDHLFENKSAFDLRIISEETFNIFRIEEGLPSYPNEINDKYNPHENGLIDFVSFSKGCYIGQEVIARLDTYDKVQRELKGIIFEENYNFELPETLFDENDNEVGELTSVADSFLLNKKIGLAYIKKRFLQDNSQAELKTLSSKKIIIKIIKLPFSNENLY
ncbi:folate-binding protein YgfZ [Melioribacteraceae bacterium 4301-Me]|uniref:CAF17-like 4Fe-4S cluster assembly/insertion protein YgfZ n=1 Tax=Pyranulibacter aquaticus TaxID=3163344 RepID=UPI0035954E3E